MRLFLKKIFFLVFISFINSPFALFGAHLFSTDHDLHCSPDRSATEARDFFFEGLEIQGDDLSTQTDAASVLTDLMLQENEARRLLWGLEGEEFKSIWEAIERFYTLNDPLYARKVLERKEYAERIEEIEFFYEFACKQLKAKEQLAFLRRNDKNYSEECAKRAALEGNFDLKLAEAQERDEIVRDAFAQFESFKKHEVYRRLLPLHQKIIERFFERPQFRLICSGSSIPHSSACGFIPDSGVRLDKTNEPDQENTQPNEAEQEAEKTPPESSSPPAEQKKPDVSNEPPPPLPLTESEKKKLREKFERFQSKNKTMKAKSKKTTDENNGELVTGSRGKGRSQWNIFRWILRIVVGYCLVKGTYHFGSNYKEGKDSAAAKKIQEITNHYIVLIAQEKDDARRALVVKEFEQKIEEAKRYLNIYSPTFWDGLKAGGLALSWYIFSFI